MTSQDDYRLLQEQEVPARPDDFVCRGNVWRAGVGAAFVGTLSAVLLLGPSLAPEVWGWHGVEVIAYPAGLFMLLFTWFAHRAWRAHLAPTNWLLRASIDGFYVRYRSPLNYDYPGEPVAVFLPRRLIRHIATATEEREKRDEDGHRVIQKVPALDIHVRTDDLASLRTALRRERSRRQPARLGKKGVFLHYPVRTLTKDVIRIEWKTPQFALSPNLKTAAEVLSRQYLRLMTTGEPETLTAEENLATLAEAGDTVEAIKQAKADHGLSTTDAKAYVERMQG